MKTNIPIEVTSKRKRTSETNCSSTGGRQKRQGIENHRDIGRRPAKQRKEHKNEKNDLCGKPFGTDQGTKQEAAEGEHEEQKLRRTLHHRPFGYFGFVVFPPGGLLEQGRVDDVPEYQLAYTRRY